MAIRTEPIVTSVPGLRAFRCGADEQHAGVKESYAFGAIDRGRNVPPRDVAPHVGVSDRSQWKRNFRRVVGMMPGRYASEARSTRARVPT